MNLNELKKYGTVTDRLYYILLIIIVSYDCLVSTPIVGNVVDLFGNSMDDYLSVNAVFLIFELIVNLRLLIIIPALYTIMVSMSSNRERMISLFAIMVGWLSSYQLREWNDHSILIITLLIIASYGRDFRKIAEYSILAITGVVLLSVVLCILGVLPDYVLERNGRIRHSFGMLGPTAIAGHMCAVILALIFCRDGRLNWFEHILVVVLSVLNVVLVDGRTVFLTVMLVYFGNIVYLVIKKKKIILPERVVSVTGRVLEYSYIAMFSIFFILAATFNDKAWALYQKTSFTESVGGRIAIASRFLHELQPSLFGNYMERYGYADRTFEQVGEYLFIDSSFARMYFIYGIAGLVGCVLLFTAIQKRLFKKKQIFRMFIVAVSGLLFVMQKGILEPGYNMLPLVLLADIDDT